jgi:hypothetical protein
MIRSRYVPLFIVVIGVIFRMWAVGYARFTGDESYFWATARNIATLDAAPVYGPPLTGSSAYHPGPIFYYLMALPQLFGTTPRLGGFFVALLHGLAAWMFHLVVRDARGERASWIALALVAFAPWDVLYADRVWLSCVAPVWGTATIYAAYRAASSTVWQGALIFFALVCPQLHMSAPVVWVFCGVLLWFRTPEKWSRRAIAIGAALAVLAYAPAIVRELTHNFENTIAILTKGTGDSTANHPFDKTLRVFGYAVLYGTSEIGYHFARGYWGPFSEVKQYFTEAGLTQYLHTHGVVWTSANVVSVVLAFASWVAALAMLVPAVRWARITEGGVRRNLAFAEVLTIALLAGLLAGLALLVGASKVYFPHYTNLLVPFALWPVVLALDRAWETRVLKYVAAGACAISVIAMASSAIRYYRDVDALNGLDPTMAMVDAVLAEDTPIILEFEHFQNSFAWQMLANTAHKKPLRIEHGAPVKFRVKNGAPHRGPAPENTTSFGPVLLQRTELRPRGTP